MLLGHITMMSVDLTSRLRAYKPTPSKTTVNLLYLLRTILWLGRTMSWTGGYFEASL